MIIHRNTFLFGLIGLVVATAILPIVTYWVYTRTLRQSTPATPPSRVVANAVPRPASLPTQADVPPPPRPIESLVKDLTSVDWPTVWTAELALEARGKEAIPALVELLESDELVKLQDTADLIYPGAAQYYGHGWLLDYDIDWLSVRAGWVLEKITFAGFGFRERAIREKQLLEATKQGRVDVPLDAVIGALKEPKARARNRSEAATRAKKWWAQSSQTWNRFDGLVDALRSDNPMRQAYAIEWLRYGRTLCKGLDRDSYERIVRPEVSRLAKSDDELVRQQAELLLENSPRSGWRIYCQDCGHDLTGASGGRCPRCGAAFAHTENVVRANSGG